MSDISDPKEAYAFGLWGAATLATAVAAPYFLHDTLESLRDGQDADLANAKISTLRQAQGQAETDQATVVSVESYASAEYGTDVQVLGTTTYSTLLEQQQHILDRLPHTTHGETYFADGVVGVALVVGSTVSVIKLKRVENFFANAGEMLYNAIHKKKQTAAPTPKVG